MSFGRLEQYEAGALSAWTPASQAALNAQRHDRQQEIDPEFEALRAQEYQARKDLQDALNIARREENAEEKERLKAEIVKLDEIWGPVLERFEGDSTQKRVAQKMDQRWGKAVGDWDDQVTAEGRLKGNDSVKKELRMGKYEMAEAISAGEVVDNFIQSWNPPICDFLNVFGPPHIVILFYIGAHIYFWFKAPWYLRFLIYQPTIYYIPLWSALTSLKDKNVRLLWTVYFMQLAIIEYIELLFYRDRARSSLMFPKMKAMFCLVSYTVVEPSDDPLYGTIKLVNIIFPPPPRPKPSAREKKAAKEASLARAKQRTERAEKEAATEIEKEKAERRARQAKQGEYIAAHS